MDSDLNAFHTTGLDINLITMHYKGLLLVNSCNPSIQARNSGSEYRKNAVRNDKNTHFTRSKHVFIILHCNFERQTISQKGAEVLLTLSDKNRFDVSSKDPSSGISVGVGESTRIFIQVNILNQHVTK